MSGDPLIAICEDDPDVRELLAAYLGSKGFQVATARNAAELDVTLAAGRVALVILDWMLPGEDGLSICRRLRGAGAPPIIMLTARDEDRDRVEGLDGGADDYVSKPFSPRVLLARINAVLRRGDPASAGERLVVADLTIRPGSREVTGPGGGEVALLGRVRPLGLPGPLSPAGAVSRSAAGSDPRPRR